MDPYDSFDELNDSFLDNATDKYIRKLYTFILTAT